MIANKRYVMIILQVKGAVIKMAKNSLEIFNNTKIKMMVHEVRDKRVLLDSDVALLFQYETKDLNRNVKNNIDRFPENYCFQLTKDEYNNLRCKNFTSSSNGNYGGRRYLPYALDCYACWFIKKPSSC